MEYDDKNQEPDHQPDTGLPPSPPNAYWQPQNMPPQKPAPQPPSTMAVLSMVLGIFSLVICCVPPLQLLLGAVSIFLAILSKKGRPFSGFAIAGLVMGILSIICSILVFLYFLLVMRMMQDPQYASMFQDLLKQYEDILKTTQSAQ